MKKWSSLVQNDHHLYTRQFLLISICTRQKLLLTCKRYPVVSHRHCHSLLGHMVHNNLYIYPKPCYICICGLIIKPSRQGYRAGFRPSNSTQRPECACQIQLSDKLCSFFLFPSYDVAIMHI